MIMALLADLAQWSIIAFAVLLFAAQVIAREAGGYLGSRNARDGTKNEGIGLIVGSILGLLAFVMALTLSTASTRHVERRNGSLQEASAIGSTWLRAKALGEPRAEEVARLMEDYILVRMAYVDAGRGTGDIAIASERTQALQTEIWGHVSALVRERNDSSVTALMNAVDHTFDMTAAQRFAVALNLPERMIWLLLSFTLVGMFALGYQLGQSGKHNRTLAILMSMLWTAVMVQILDMGNSRLGSYRTDLEPYQWTLDGFSDIPIPVLSPT
jgi:hypothetical protein